MNCPNTYLDSRANFTEFLFQILIWPERDILSNLYSEQRIYHSSQQSGQPFWILRKRQKEKKLWALLMSVLVERHIMDFHGMQEPDVSLVEKSEYSLHPLMHSPCMKDRPRKAISTYCHKRHLLGQFFIQYWPLLVPMGSKDYRNPALIIFRATLTRSLE